MAIFFSCVGGAATLCMLLPESYRSTTLILVESQKIPENYVKALIGPSIEDRLNSIQQQVMSRTVLTQMIEEFGLYPDALRTHGVEWVVERLRKDITVTTMGSRSQRGSGGIDAFSISFAHESPLLAMKVTSRLASNFIEENLKVREQLVEGASEFLEQELVLAKERLEGQERAISAFKTRHMGELPEQMQANISALDRLQLQQGSTIEALQKASDRLALFDKMLKDYESPGSMTAGTTQGPGGVVIADPLVLRLKELEKNLTTLSAEYKDNYPDIINLKQEIQTLKELIKNKVGRDDAPAKPSDSTTQREIKTPDLYLRELVRQRDEVKLEIASLKERLARTKDQMKEYESRVEKTPSREQELEILVRDYNNLKENYRTLLDKKLNARLAENLEKRQKGEQFRIVDPANLPAKPEKPNRVNIMLVGFALGCALGVGSAVGMESFRPVFRRPDDVETLLQLRVLAAIPNYGEILASTRKALPRNVIAPIPGREIKGLLLPVNESESRQSGKYEKKLTGEGGGSSDLESPRILKQSATLREFELIGKWSPWSVVAEQFRVAATRLALSLATERGKVAVITSAVKGEGKSAVAANLAYALARDMGKATLLIDGDLKCPTLHQYLGVRQSPGLRDVLQGTRSLDSCIQQEGELPLWTLPSGRQADRLVDLSRINQIGERVEELKGKFDYIIIDAPPILPLADMHMIARMADILILVIRAGLTPRKIVENAVRTLGVSNIHIILNGLETAGVPSYMREGYEYALERKE